MARFTETFTTCAGPGVARPHQRIGGLAGLIIQAWYASGTLTIIGGLAYLTWLVFQSPPWAWCATAAALIFALNDIKHWFYHERLLCIRQNECTIGSVISQPTVSFDGDRKINLLLAPFSEHSLALYDHLHTNIDMLSDPANFEDNYFPGPPNWAEMRHNLGAIREYMIALRGEFSEDKDKVSYMFNQIAIGTLHRMMSDVNGNPNPKTNFFERFYRTTNGYDTFIPDTATRSVIPNDFADINWLGPGARTPNQFSNPQTNKIDWLNPMFRFGLVDTDTGKNEVMGPYLHCEVEGNYVEVLLNDFITALSGFTVGCVIGGPIVGAIVGFVAWLIKKIVDWISGNDGDAAPLDLNWEDPQYAGEDLAVSTAGDVVAVYGRWVMDTEHHQFFEIHPVTAYYKIAESSAEYVFMSGDYIFVPGQEIADWSTYKYDVYRMTPELAKEICEFMSAVETVEESKHKTVTGSAALAYGLKANYA